MLDLGARGSTDDVRRRRRSATSTSPGRTRRTSRWRRRTARSRSSTRRSASWPSRTSPWSTRTSSARARRDGRQGVPRVPLHARGPGDHRQELLPPDRSRGAREAPRRTSRRSQLFTITAVAKSWDDASDQVLRRRRRVRQLLQAEVTARSRGGTHGMTSTSIAACCPGFGLSLGYTMLLPAPAGARPDGARGS